MATSKDVDLTESFTVDLYYSAGSTEANMQKSLKYYKDTADTYDSHLAAHGYRGPQQAVPVVLKHVPKDAYILNIGAGTGADGQLLYDQGYTKIDAHDGSPEMLKIAKERGIFQNFYEEMLLPDAQSKLPSDTYDALVCVGCFAPNHLNDDHLEDMLRPVKKGGHIIIGTREIFTKDPGDPFNWHYNLDDKIKTLEKERKLKVIERNRFEKYHEGKFAGIFYVLVKI